MAKLIKLAKMAGVMHEADHAYSIQSTWRSDQLATDVPFMACVQFSSVQFSSVQFSSVQFSSVQFSSVQFSFISYM